MRQFRTPYMSPEVEYDDRDTPISIGKVLEALTPLIVGFLVIILGLSLFVVITANSQSPINGVPGPGNVGAYSDARYGEYSSIFNEASYKKIITTAKPSALGYALYISCVEYKSQLACTQFDLLYQQHAKDLEQRKG